MLSQQNNSVHRLIVWLSLGWKGGVERELKKKGKFGTLNYLAQWQGLRGEDLDVDLTNEVEIVCSLTGMKVIFYR